MGWRFLVESDIYCHYESVMHDQKINWTVDTFTMRIKFFYNQHEYLLQTITQVQSGVSTFYRQHGRAWPDQSHQVWVDLYNKKRTLSTFPAHKHIKLNSYISVIYTDTDMCISVHIHLRTRVLSRGSQRSSPPLPSLYTNFSSSPLAYQPVHIQIWYIYRIRLVQDIMWNWVIHM